MLAPSTVAGGDDDYAWDDDTGVDCGMSARRAERDGADRQCHPRHILDDLTVSAGMIGRQCLFSYNRPEKKHTYTAGVYI
jgi:hypothetical protein